MSLRFNGYYLLSALLLLVFIGLRSELGRDWENYERIYNSVGQEFVIGMSREFGFLSLIDWCNGIGIQFQGFVVIITIITLTLFFLSYKQFYYLLPAAIFIFFVDLGYASIINLMRQTLALFAFMCALNYSGKTDRKSMFMFFLFIFIGFSFHYSILIFLPFWFIDRLHLSLSKLLIICAGVFIFCHFFLAEIYGDALELIPKYSAAYSDSSDINIINTESTFGLGALLVLFIRLIPLMFYNIMLKEDKQFEKYFIMLYLGLSIYYGFYNYLIITRITFYLQFSQLVVMPYIIYKSFKTRNSSYQMLGLLFIFLISFNFIYTFPDFINGHVVARQYHLMFMDFMK